MQIISKEAYSYILMEDNGDWFLTFMTGGVFEVDICVKLNTNEIKTLQENPESVLDLMKSFKFNRSLYEGRRVVPSVWPEKQ